MPQDRDPHDCLGRVYRQIIRVLDQLDSLQVEAKERIAVVNATLIAFNRWSELSKDDAAVAGSTARKFEDAFQRKKTDDAGRRGRDPGADASNGAADPAELDDLWKQQSS